MEERWKEHCSDANAGSDAHFHRALRLYGKENWIHEIVASDIDTIEEANSLEKYYIKYYNSFENGYNSTDGGDSFIKSEEVQAKITKKLENGMELRL